MIGLKYNGNLQMAEVFVPLRRRMGVRPLHQKACGQQGCQGGWWGVGER